MALEDFFSLFCDWYNLNSPFLRSFGHVSEDTFANMWTNKWFAKKQQQVIMDTYLKKYQHLFDVDVDELQEHLQGQNLLVFRIACLILWDQISRNIFRGTANAYATDGKARALVEKIIPFWDNLPTPIKVSCILVYIHSEDIHDLEKVNEYINKISSEMGNFPSVFTALKGVAKNHYDRMIMFGRIPERNILLNRKSTAEEESYLAAF